MSNLVPYVFRSKRVNSLHEMCLQGLIIMAVEFIILEAIFVLINTTTMIPYWGIS